MGEWDLKAGEAWNLLSTSWETGHPALAQPPRADKDTRGAGRQGLALLHVLGSAAES